MSAEPQISTPGAGEASSRPSPASDREGGPIGRSMALAAEVARLYGTPAVVVGLDIVEANIARVQALCDRAGLTNRPHVKTHKSPVLARMQRDAGARGITCQKLGEAEVMATESESEPRLDAGQGQMFKAV